MKNARNQLIAAGVLVLIALVVVAWLIDSTP